MIGEQEYRLLRDEIGENMKLQVQTEEGDIYTGVSVEINGATLVLVTEKGKYVEIRWGRGTKQGNKQPYATLGVDGPDSFETEQIVTESKNGISITRERGKISYDYIVDEIMLLEEDWENNS